MFSKISSILCICLLLTAVTVAQEQSVKLNGGLVAEILSLGRSADQQFLTISMRIANKGKDTAYLMLVGKEIATDNKGGVFDWRYNISGIADAASTTGNRRFA